MILAARVLGCFVLQGGYARAFNSEEHKVLVDLAVSEVIQPDAVQLPWPTHFEDSPIGVLKAAYDNAKILAVGYADNNPTWRSYCLNVEIDPETKPQGYSQYASFIPPKGNSRPNWLNVILAKRETHDAGWSVELGTQATLANPRGLAITAPRPIGQSRFLPTIGRDPSRRTNAVQRRGDDVWSAGPQPKAAPTI